VFDLGDDRQVEVGAQGTYIRQNKPEFGALYSGPRSLRTSRELAYTFTSTLYIGARLGNGWEAYLNPEVTQGVPLSDLQGLGGFSNGEQQRSAGPNPILYRARAYVKRTWDLGGEMEVQDSDANQVKTRYAAERVAVTFGNLSVLDLFDAVDYSRDPRTQFMNWSFLTHGAWDFGADARGYTWGLAAEYISPRFSLRGGRFLVPRESNGLALNFSVRGNYSDAVEAELPWLLGTREGTARLLAYRNQTEMGSFDDALARGAAAGLTPDLTQVRRSNAKRGIGLSVQQAITDSIGLFGRIATNDGRTETYMFTEIDRSFSTGALVQGRAWGRERDSAGIALAVNGLSSAHRSYLAAGGQGFFLGDGRLNYGREQIIEVFYSLGVARGVSLSAGLQHIDNPGYNRDRGPVNVFSVRLHAQTY
jgi:hypothetical protein